MAIIEAGDLERFALKCYRIGPTIEEVQKTGIGAAALVTKKTILRSAEAHRWPTKGKRAVRVNYTVTPNSAIIRGVGFAAMFEKGAKPHREPKTRGRKAGHKINIPGIGVFDHIAHPGFHGRGFWDEGVATAAPLVSAEFKKGLELGMRRLFS